ncbi:MAG: DUF2442 domain-containing protein [Firmicutes bacterium]|nr:DUF2442 domain-containing protein [Bacillota bacterium]
MGSPRGAKPIRVRRAVPLPNLPKARAVRFVDGQVVFELTNGGELRFPLDHFPRLAAATPAERAAWRIVWDGEAVRWDAIDEDVSLRLLLTGEC